MTDLPKHVGRQTDPETGYALVCNATPAGNPDTDPLCGQPATHHVRWELVAPDPAQAGDGVLGRALLDRDGYVWPDKDNQATTGQGKGEGIWLSRDEIVQRYGLVREVLLVSPAAWERSGADLARWLDHREMPPETTVTELVKVEREVATVHARFELLPLIEAARRVAGLRTLGDAHDWRQVAALYRELRAAVDALGDDQAAEPGRCEQPLVPDPLLDDEEPCGNPVPCRDHPAEPAPEPDSGTDIRTATPGVSAQVTPGNGADTGPDGGPGWDPDTILDAAKLMEPAGDFGALAAKQLRALLADRDRRISPERYKAAMDDLARVAARADQEVDAARAELADWQHNLALRAFTAPDTDLETMLASLDSRIRDARRDAAADALDDARSFALVRAADEEILPERRRMHAEYADALGELATEIRRGTRPVPGSPQPAEGDGNDG